MDAKVTAIVLAAGAGTRMKSERAKVLHELGGRSMLGHALAAVRELGVEQRVVVVGHQREQVEAATTALDSEALIAVQHERKGTGDAVRAGLDALEAGAAHGTVLITYGDVPLLTAETLRAVVDEHRADARAVTILSAEVDDPTGYGRILRGDDGTVTAIREHKDASENERSVREINSGILAVDGTFLDAALGRLTPKNAQGELYLTDIVGFAVADGLPVGAHVLEDVWQTEGVNDRAQLARLARELNDRITRRWMLDGVTIIDPATTWIDSDVTLAPDVTVRPGTQLLGATTVAGGATIGPDTTLRNVEIGEDATIERTHGSDAVIGAGATVGPFAYLRPGTELGAKGKIGTFVETKNAQIADGAKVPHLSYIGDAEIGEGTNIGAGTITANYDGERKHRTVVGRHAKTGSDNVFVAPVEIGDGAFTGAGTIVREDVPPGALAVSAGGQRIMDGWVARRRPGSAAHEAAENAARQEENPQ
ncbi:bifunctional UDP-N-acetylglucosamine diphosphorylase/glucosamine-1-phosphate N-acetyltransferase GlmU [Aeromicrobium sp. YIM 150415]|uniref:bifunctional UDP-N-acetylglucosamine diphosphorylase/glucosamine-1-phosphate N-acetyltransferase GlmU n=1 Tax=Aeromicrobium sp. YIM 150415 TaxID=2803912 RepID=UPI001965F806|nr:bifunctional UDP-N-acetylglucosamine diphosphorylase/glucosamine-1-phosphate N-acetyltransferase GlmU [Aeromicrobium sp. YIM 150415]MBM9461961.1 bifunctional UDP-N-acetylglucosamine diphosphorylase/glucosamine-1-phosphate N-acetyltransferase GlmU [Aeromicrobium sp. YIM 150415]